jgi:SAM-dependent methyltransferase
MREALQQPNDQNCYMFDSERLDNNNVNPGGLTITDANLLSIPGDLLADVDICDKDRTFKVTSSTIQNVSELSAKGYRVSFVDKSPRYMLDRETQDDVDKEIDTLSEREDCTTVLFDPGVHPVGHAWFQLRKRAIALHPLYNVGSISTLGEGINPDVYDEPLFDGLSAVQILQAEDGPEKTSAMIDKYRAFIGTPMEDATGFYPSSRDFLTGVIDSQAVQTRVDTAIDMVETHIESNAERYKEKGIVCASLACGSAGPVYEMANRLIHNGVNIEKLILVDNDPLALASAFSLSKSYGISDRIQIIKSNIMSDDLIDVIGSEVVDVVDLLGIFEYIPRSLRLAGVNYRVAELFLRNAMQVLRPGGIAVVGNMLADRPQQRFFKKVWPRLYQRTVSEVIEIIEEAGIDPMSTEIKVPAREGVYAIYGFQKTLETAQTPDIIRYHELAKRLMSRLSY